MKTINIEPVGVEYSRAGKTGSAMRGSSILITHEGYIQKIRELSLETALARGIGDTTLAKVRSAKLVYGYGQGGIRGIARGDAWKNGHVVDAIEILASAEENAVQLAGTTIHECAHIADMGAAHGVKWRKNCDLFGLRLARAVGMKYHLSSLAPAIREYVQRVTFGEGTPHGVHTSVPVRAVGCTFGRGSRGGTSRGVGSGSRLRKWVCSCTPAVIVRVSRDDFSAHCDICGHAFRRPD